MSDLMIKAKYESTWILTNMATTNDEACIEELLRSELHLFIDELLGHEKPIIVEQALWYMGNLAGNDERCRLLVL